MNIKDKIIQYLKEEKKVDEAKLHDVVEGSLTYRDLKRSLIEKNILTEEEIILILSKELSIPFLDLKKYKIPEKNKEVIPQETAVKYKVVPVHKIGKVLTLAVVDPSDVVAHDNIKLIAGVERIDLLLCKEEDMQNVLSQLYEASSGDMTKVLQENESLEAGEKEVNEGEASLEDLICEGRRPPIVRAVDTVIYNALKKRASDIHIEATEDGLKVKYRVDGVLYDQYNFSKKNQLAIAARLKIISSLNLTESRLPQDGRFKIKFENRQIDFRVSSLPTQFGEKFVLRILDKENLSIGLESLGFSPQPLAAFQKASKAPFGIILVTGPTGSGKSTTLYSILNQLSTPEKNIVTIEDPVEYYIEGLTQIQVNPEIGLTFANGLRSVLRQSPDIIMVGEIRDAETADIAIKASLTGEFILSTLHTNNAVGAVTRLIDMGVEPFLLASSLVASTAQRLVRKLCPKCKEKYQLEDVIARRLGVTASAAQEVFRAKGCSYCNNTGYRGRIAILEILLVDEKIKDMIIERKSEEEITQYAKKEKGYNVLREDGFLKCVEGITSIEEVLSVTEE